MKQIFPKEILENTTEVFKFKHTSTSKIIYTILLLTISSALLLLPFVKVDVYTSVRGILKADEERISVGLIHSGRVLFSFVENNKNVMVGDTILIIENKIIDEKIQLSLGQIKEIKLFISDLANLTINNSKTFNLLNSLKYQKEYMFYEQNLSELETRFKQKKNNLDRNQILVDKGVIAQAEFENIKFEYDVALSGIYQLKKQQQNSWQADLTSYKNRLQEMKSEEIQLLENKSQFFITAPITGILLNTTRFETGSFVVQGTRIAEISPDTDLIVECYLGPADIGLIKASNKVIFQIDAYNYNQWGLAEGTIIEIGKDFELIDNKPIFKIRCLINQDYLELKNGFKGKFKKGMTLNARFILAERSLFDLLYDKTDDWLNPGSA